MKRIITAITAVLVGFGSSYAASSVYDDEQPGGWNFEVPFGSVTYSHSAGCTSFEADVVSSFSFGFIAGVNQKDGVGIDMGQSYEMEWGNVISASTRLGRKGLVRIGLGFDWRNYRMTNNQMFLKDGPTGVITVAPMNAENVGSTAANIEPQFSRIHTFSLSVPLKFYYKISRKAHIAMGPELYFTPHASLKTRFKEDGNKVKLTDKNLHFNRFSVGLGAEVSVCKIGVYYKYNPFNVLSSDFGPGFNSMTVGLKVGF